MEKIELLAPAGNLRILKAAVDSGADAVYCGLTVFNARINAENLTLGQFEEGVDYAHVRSSKVYLTVNTLVNDSEREDLFDAVAKACEAGADGLIVQDLAVLKMLREAFPDVRINASTQMNIYSRDQYKELSRLGVNRVVLPRELSMDEISSRVHIAAKYGIDCEVFAHGAVCVCASGLCLFSAMNKAGTRSGNRGTCAQPCREEYKLYNDGLKIKSGHLLSPKDRDVSDYLSSLIESGVASLKLEGRMPEKKEKHNSREIVGEEYGLSRNTVARLIRINKLNDGIKSWVDDGRLSIRAAVELSYMDSDRQKELYIANTDRDNGDMLRKISEKTAKLLRNAENAEAVSSVLSYNTKRTSASKAIRLDADVYEKYFNGMNYSKVAFIVEQALEMYFGTLSSGS